MTWLLNFRPWFILAYLLLFGVSLWLTVTHLNVHTDTQNMISDKLPWRQDFIRYQSLFASQHQNLYVVLEGPTPEITEAIALTFKEALQTKSQDISVFSYPLTSFFQKNRLLYASQEELNELTTKAPSLLPLFNVTIHDLGLFLNTLSKQIAHPRAQKQMLPFLDSFQNTLEASQRGQSHPIEGSALLGGPKANTHLHIVEVKAPLKFANSLPGEEALDTIKNTYQQLDHRWAKDVSMAITGEVALANEELKGVSQGAELAALAAFIMVAALLMISFRSWRLVLIALISLILGLVFTAAFATLAIGHLNMISVAFAVLYIGLSVDFTIHIILRYRELSQQGVRNLEAIKTTLKHLSPSLMLCALTTSIAFYSFIPTSFNGVSELGLIAGTGMLISLIINMTWLPILLSYHPCVQSSQAKRSSTHWDLPIRYPKTVVSVFLLVVLVSIPLSAKIEFNADPMTLRDPNQPSVIAFQKLLKTLDYPPNSAAVLVPLDQLADMRTQLGQLTTVNNTLDIEDFVPSDQDKKIDTIRTMKSIFENKSVTAAHEETLAYRIQAFKNLTQSVQDHFPDHPLNQALDHYRQDLTRLTEQQRSERLELLSQDVLFGLVTRLNQLKASLNAQPFDVKQLPSELIERWVSNNTYRLEVFPKGSMQDPNAREPFVTQLLTVAPHATGLPVIHEKAGEEVINAFVQAFMTALIAMVFLLTVVLRDVKKILLTLVPLLSACLMTAALSSLFSLDFNFANIIALPLLLGVGIDNGIHLVHRFYSQTHSVHVLQTSTSRAVLVSTLTTVFSFANLALSKHQGMSSMGMMLTLGMVMMLLATLVLLPALLTLLNGKNKSL